MIDCHQKVLIWCEDFYKVILNSGKEYSIKEWNEIFTDLDPKSSSTGTNVQNNQIKTSTKKEKKPDPILDSPRGE